MNIKEFAAKIGVSPTTASSAFTGNGRLSAATREMVVTRAKELGFTPNVNARRLVSGRSYMVALSHVDPRAASDLFTVQVARSIVEPLKSRGYDLWLNLAPDNEKQYALLRQLAKSCTIDGSIILGEEKPPRKLLQDLAKRVHPCVLISHAPVSDIPFVGSVVINMQTGAEQAARHLAELGHKRIGIIDSDLRDSVSVFFRDTLKTLGISISEYNYTVAGRGLEDGGRAFVRLMSRSEKPTAIFARTDVLAISAIRAAREMGLFVPHDVSIIGHDDLSLLAFAEPGLTTIRIDCVRIAEEASDMLCTLLGTPDARMEPRVIDTNLVIRKTTGKTGRQEDKKT
jgi:DNA-binding LacI/PurR family transcriptional regulator